MAVGVEEADGAFDLLLHMLAFHAHLVPCHTEFSPGQLAEGGFHKAVVNGVMIHYGSVVRAFRKRAVGARRVPVHDGAVAQIARLDSRVEVRHGLIKFHEAKIPVYDIDIVFIIYVHFIRQLPNFFRTVMDGERWGTFLKKALPKPL